MLCQTATFIDENGMRTVVGNVFSFNVPGEGVILQGTGRVVFELTDPNDFLFEAGQHDPISLICGYLPPERGARCAAPGGANCRGTTSEF